MDEAHQSRLQNKWIDQGQPVIQHKSMLHVFTQYGFTAQAQGRSEYQRIVILEIMLLGYSHGGEAVFQQKGFDRQRVFYLLQDWFNDGKLGRKLPPGDVAELIDHLDTDNAIAGIQQVGDNLAFVRILVAISIQQDIRIHEVFSGHWPLPGQNGSQSSPTGILPIQPVRLAQSNGGYLP